MDSLLICSEAGPWAFLAGPLESVGVQVDSLVLKTPKVLVAVSQQWVGEEGFLLCSALDGDHLGQSLDSGVSERNLLPVADPFSLLHCHSVLACYLKCIRRTELQNENAEQKFSMRERLKHLVHYSI